MLNNMLGEEDINPHGFHQWPLNTRMSSMMAPTLVLDPEVGITALGSGGSNRIRTAILQVLLNSVVFRMALEDAVTAPRIHVEGEKLSIEHGYSEAEVDALGEDFPDMDRWGERNMFFGGVHAVRRAPNGEFEGAGDIRRGGVAIVA
jgi:gamma-glutamyltranspeptidase/glutathione hydrolase